MGVGAGVPHYVEVRGQLAGVRSLSTLWVPGVEFKGESVWVGFSPFLKPPFGLT